MKSALAFVILILSSLSAPRCGATVYHSDGSAANVQYLHDNSAHNGDTITLPTGAFTWATGVTIRKGIILQGVAGATQINRAGYSGALVSITGLPSDLPVRVTGIRFNSPVGQGGDLWSIYVNGPYGGTRGLTQLRIDNCYFYGGERTIYLRYRINGVADHNTFHNCAYITEYFGDDDFAWTRAGTPAFGTSDAFFFEDNTIIADTGIGFFDTLSDQNTGGKLVWRHNTFDVTAYTGVFGSLIGEHGNQAYWQGHDDWLRGGIMHEFYNNTVRFGTAFRIIWFRGGRNIVANNTFIGTITSRLISFDEEEGYGGSGIHPPRTTWPGEDQVNNSFFFGNTLNGNPVNSSLIGTWDSRSDPYIRVNRDYWLQAPSGLTVTTYPQPGYPSLPNYPLPYNPAVTSWTPYTYPHPLAAGGSPSPTPTPTPTPAPTPGGPRTDFNGDGKPDYVLQNASTQQTAVWYLNNNVYIGGAFTPTLPGGWIVVSAADFNRDGHPDYALFRPSTRQTVIWYFSGVTRIGSTYGPTPPGGWALVATGGDFNNDGKPDYVLYNASTRQTVVWYLNNNVYIGGAYGPTLPAGWSLVGVADFNRDGKSDYLLFNASTHQTAIFYLAGTTWIGTASGPTPPAGWSLVGVADFNRDGKPDYLLFNASTRQTVIWYMNNNVRIGGAYGPTLPAGWTVAAP